jgi:hypothetical protein
MFKDMNFSPHDAALRPDHAPAPGAGTQDDLERARENVEDIVSRGDGIIAAVLSRDSRHFLTVNVQGSGE